MGVGGLRRILRLMPPALAALFVATTSATAYQMECSSSNYKYNYCRASGAVFNAAITRQMSRPPGDCVYGRSWGWDRFGVWVNHGCRAAFEVRLAGAPPGPPPPRPPGFPFLPPPVVAVPPWAVGEWQSTAPYPSLLKIFPDGSARLALRSRRYRGTCTGTNIAFYDGGFFADLRRTPFGLRVDFRGGPGGLFSYHRTR